MISGVLPLVGDLAGDGDLPRCPHGGELAGGFHGPCVSELELEAADSSGLCGGAAFLVSPCVA